MENKSFVIWNNKGGVGKSTITFHLASLYAELHPERDIVVVDMCPQANSSSIFLGGGKKSDEVLQKIISLDEPRTIVGYITDQILSRNSPLDHFTTKLDEINTNLAKNLYLIAGDGNLELIAPLLSERATHKPISANDNPWKNIHLIIQRLTERKINEDRPCTYFIDTNPSFSIYTQLAIIGGKELLVPINADDSSIFAIYGLFNLIWGTSNSHPVYGGYTFAKRAKDEELPLPKISKIIGNRFTQRKGAAHAFSALSNEATNVMYKFYKSNPEFFVDKKSSINTPEDFETNYSIELRDFNSAGVVAANQGLPLNKMNRHDYIVHDEKIQVHSKQRKACQEVIRNLALSI